MFISGQYSCGVLDKYLSEQIISRRLTLMNADFSRYTAFRLVLESNSWARWMAFCSAPSRVAPVVRHRPAPRETLSALQCAKPELRAAYDQAHLWVYGDFTFTQPIRRPDDFE